MENLENTINITSEELPNADPNKVQTIELPDAKLEDVDTKLYNSITDMSDSELKEAIDTSATAESIEEVKDNAFDIDESKDGEELTPNQMFLKTMQAEDLITLYDLAIKAKNNPKFNVVSELPKSMYDLIVKEIYNQTNQIGISKKDLSKFIRMLIINLGEEIEDDAEFKSIKKDLTDILKEGQLEFVNAYADYSKETFVTELQAKAEKETDPKIKAKLLELSTAYTESYELKKQMDLLDDEIFMRRLIKNESKRFNLLCDDFDFTLNKKFMHKISIRDLFNLLPKIIKVNELQIKDYIIATCIATRGVATDDAPGLMYMYNSINIIKILFQSSDILDDDKAQFIKDCMKNVKDFFAKLENAKQKQTVGRLV